MMTLSDQHFQEFRDMIDSCDLIDLGYSGLAYIWSNKRRA